MAVSHEKLAGSKQISFNTIAFNPQLHSFANENFRENFEGKSTIYLRSKLV
jgi:hypothetical protein